MQDGGQETGEAFVQVFAAEGHAAGLAFRAGRSWPSSAASSSSPAPGPPWIRTSRPTPPYESPIWVVEKILADQGGEILDGPNQVPTGRNLTVRYTGGPIIEYVEPDPERLRTLAP